MTTKIGPIISDILKMVRDGGKILSFDSMGPFMSEWSTLPVTNI